MEKLVVGIIGAIIGFVIVGIYILVVYLIMDGEVGSIASVLTTGFGAGFGLGMLIASKIEEDL